MYVVSSYFSTDRNYSRIQACSTATTNTTTTAGTNQAFWYVHRCSAISDKGVDCSGIAQSIGCWPDKEKFHNEKELRFNY